MFFTGLGGFLHGLSRLTLYESLWTLFLLTLGNDLCYCKGNYPKCQTDNIYKCSGLSTNPPSAHSYVYVNSLGPSKVPTSIQFTSSTT